MTMTPIAPRVALFVPCFIDSSFPEIGVATLQLLERLGCIVEYPFNQTCCGQPLANEGDQKNAAACEALFVQNFAGYDYIVGPSASCIHHIRQHLDAIEQTAEVTQVRTHAYELVEFLHDILQIRDFPWASFPHKVALHNSCTSLRSLQPPLASMSEIRGPVFSKPKELLANVPGIEWVELERADECCGFGGLFSIFEEGVSAKMGYDKVDDQRRAGAEYIVSADMSCLMHQKGCAQRLGYGQKYIHIAQILNGDTA